MTYVTIQRVSVPNLESIGLLTIELFGESWRIFYYVIWENGPVGILLPTIMAVAI